MLRSIKVADKRGCLSGYGGRVLAQQLRGRLAIGERLSVCGLKGLRRQDGKLSQSQVDDA